MKLRTLVPAMVLLAPMVATAQTSHSGLYMGPTIQIRGGGGGDALETVTYTDGDTQTIRGGKGVEIAAGWHVQPYRNSPFDLRAQVGYKYYGTHADNVNIHMDRVTWELIPTLQFGAGFWGGVGLLMHTNIKIHNDGVLPDYKFKNAFGPDFQLGWRWFALTYTNMKYKYEPTDEKFSANSLGLQFTWSFGWTCCGGSDRPTRAVSTPAAPVYSQPVYAPVYTPAAEPTPTPPPAPVAMEPAPAAELPAVTAAPVPAQAPAPAPAPAATPSSSVGSAQLVPGAVLRSGASMKSAGIRTLPDGGEVKLIKRETNTEGPWWMVQLEDGTTGWMIEWGLTRIKKN